MFAETHKILPLLEPKDIVATATPSSYLDLNFAEGPVEFQIPFGAIASTDSTGEVVVTLECSTAGSSNSGEQAMAFNYRLSAAVDTDTMGAITAATASGAAVNNTADNKVLLIYVDPAAVAAVAADMRFCRVVITPTSEITSTLIGGVQARFKPRYPGNSIPSST